MKSFTEQLAATDANLDRLRDVAAERPDLFETGASLIDVTPSHSRVYIHASLERERDWKALALKYSHANWRRGPSASEHGYYDWIGEIEGVEILILQADRREESRPLFAEAEVVEVERVRVVCGEKAGAS